MTSKHLVFLVTILFLVTTACYQNDSIEAKSEAVERYLQAKVHGDAQTVRMLLCAEMERLWEREAHSFEMAGGAEIRGLSCHSRPEENIVDCQGEITANYGGEERYFPLSSYQVKYEGGNWRWCGEVQGGLE